jgi:PAS domain S-box-containing protein
MHFAVESECPTGRQVGGLEHMERLRLRLVPSHGVLLGLVALSIAALSAGRGTTATAFQDSIGPLVALTVAASVLVRRPRRRQPWLLLSAATLSLGLGQTAADSGWGAVAGDSFEVAGLVLMTLSLIVLVAAGPGRRAARMLFVDAAAVFVAATAALWIFVCDEKFESVHATVSARFDFMVFPLLDVFVLALAARLALTGAVRIPSYRLLAAGVAVGGFGDLFWRSFGANGPSPVWVSSGYCLGYLLFAAAALHPSMRELLEVRVPEEQTLTRLRVLFLGCSSAVVPILLIARHDQIRADVKDFTVVALAATLIPLLVGYRLIDLARIARATTAALRGSEQLYRHVVEGSPSLICLLDTEARVVYMSPAAEALTGYTNEEAEGQSVWSLLRPEDLPTLIEGFPAAAGGSSTQRLTIHAKTKTGEDLYLDGSVALVHGYGNRHDDLILAIAHDATKEVQDAAARAELEERLQQAEKLESIGQLAGGIAHDFNNLLLAIRGYGELAVRELQLDDAGAAAKDIKEVLLAADRAADLTRQLLAFGRRQVLKPELLDLNDLICDAVGALGQLLGPRIELCVVPAEGPVRVRADRSQLTQAIMNLATNARDAMPGGGALTITTSVSGTEALLTVTDTGSGMPAATAKQIFEPFFTTKTRTGAGLGLATAHGFVDQSGGSIDVETERGLGTRFTIRLPLVQETPEPDARTAPAASGDAEGSRTVLLIEDTPVVRTVVRAFLESDHYHVLEAERGEDALTIARAHGGVIDLVLTDIILPGMDGKQAAEELRAVRPGIKVLYMSGYTNDSELQAGGLPPRTAFLQKPFSGDELREALRGLDLARSSARPDLILSNEP